MRREPAEHPFKFYSGVPCLDFLVTLRGRKEEKRETLQSFSAFIDWCRLAGIINDSQATRYKTTPSRAAAECLREAIRLRETLYRIFSGVTANRTPSDADLTRLNRLLRHETCYSQIRLDPDGHPLKETVTVPRGPWQPLMRVGQSAVDLLTSDQLGQLKACANPRCAVFFIDQSRNHSRRWCSMARCGNLIKVTRFYARRRAALAAHGDDSMPENISQHASH
jgi:predicted RNA-binding Zn ribbon-like protein